jgi:peroxiredoxin
MAIFFTLTNADLELIGIEDENDRKKILDFIGSVKTPIKSKAYRH